MSEPRLKAPSVQAAQEHLHSTYEPFATFTKLNLMLSFTLKVEEVLKEVFYYIIGRQTAPPGIQNEKVK